MLNKPFNFSSSLGTAFFIDDDPAVFPDPYDYSGSADFFNTATVTNVLVTDEFDVPIPGVTLNADSNARYPLATVHQVPEPQSLALLATGIIELLGYGWRKRGQEA